MSELYFYYTNFIILHFYYMIFVVEIICSENMELSESIESNETENVKSYHRETTTNDYSRLHLDIKKPKKVKGKNIINTPPHEKRSVFGLGYDRV